MSNDLKSLAKRLLTAAIVCVAAIAVGTVWAEDEVHRHAVAIPLRGTITQENAREVTIQRKDTGKAESVPLNEIARVKYDGKVGLELSQADLLDQSGEYSKAAETYANAANESAAREPARRAAEFGRVRALARHALRDGTDTEQPIQALEQFRTRHPNSRFHYVLHELLGQLELSRDNIEGARSAFAELARSPWPEYQLRATNYDAKVLMAAGQFEQAIAKFDEVARSNAAGPEQKMRRYEALLGKAECLVRQKQYPEAERDLRALVAEASGEQAQLHAPAFALLGDIQRESGRAEEAIRSYLYVDLLYAREHQEHAKALRYLALLWQQVGKPERAEEARARLKKDYPNSPWAKHLDGQLPGQ